MYRVRQARLKEVIMPMVNPLNPRNVNEVLRRDRTLREESLRRESGYDDEPSSRQKPKVSLVRMLAKLIGGRSK
jgi:hypothetical protein